MDHTDIFESYSAKVRDLSRRAVNADLSWLVARVEAHLAAASLAVDAVKSVRLPQERAIALADAVAATGHLRAAADALSEAVRSLGVERQPTVSEHGHDDVPVEGAIRRLEPVVDLVPQSLAQDRGHTAGQRDGFVLDGRAGVHPDPVRRFSRIVRDHLEHEAPGVDPCRVGDRDHSGHGDVDGLTVDPQQVRGNDFSVAHGSSSTGITAAYYPAKATTPR